MKKTLLFLACGLICVNNLFAQINLTTSSYASSQIRIDSFKNTTSTTSYPSFAAAINGTWDLSTLTDTTGYTSIYRVATVSPSTFADSNFYSLAGNAYQGNVLSAIASGGYTQTGINIHNVKYPLAAGDTIFILAQNSVFTSPHNVIKFPATMSSSWSSTYESDFNYELTYVPGYTHAPGIVKSFYTEKDSVIGWGKMRVKTSTGVSGYMSVLQVRAQITRVDTFYLNGGITDPAIPQLLTILGATQGQVTNTYAQNYYRVDEVSPLAYVQFTDNANTTPTKVTTHAQRLSPNAVSNVANEAGVKIYPNPVTGRTISIDVPSVTGTWQYELINVSGQTVSAEVLSLSTTQTHAQVQLSNAITPGIYYIRLMNDGKQVVVRALDIN